MIILLILALIILAVVLNLRSDKKKRKYLEERYPDYKIMECNNYFILFKENIILAHKVMTKKEKLHVTINELNEIKIYEDGKEASAGKAIVGGVTFGVIGALIGSSMKTQYVNRMGIKLYTDKGCLDLRFITKKTKRDGTTYNLASQTLDNVYSKIIKYQNVKSLN